MKLPLIPSLVLVLIFLLSNNTIKRSSVHAITQPNQDQRSPDTTAVTGQEELTRVGRGGVRCHGGVRCRIRRRRRRRPPPLVPSPPPPHIQPIIFPPPLVPSPPPPRIIPIIFPPPPHTRPIFPPPRVTPVFPAPLVPSPPPPNMDLEPPFFPIIPSPLVPSPPP